MSLEVGFLTSQSRIHPVAPARRNVSWKPYRKMPTPRVSIVDQCTPTARELWEMLLRCDTYMASLWKAIWSRNSQVFTSRVRSMTTYSFLLMSDLEFTASFLIFRLKDGTDKHFTELRTERPNKLWSEHNKRQSKQQKRDTLQSDQQLFNTE